MGHFLFTYSNVLYKESIYGWDWTSAYREAAGSCHQSTSNLTLHLNEWNDLGLTTTLYGSSMPYSLQIVCGFFYIPLGWVNSERLWGKAYSLQSLSEKTWYPTIRGCNYKGSTFSSFISRSWGFVLESNSHTPAQQPDAQPSHPCTVMIMIVIVMFDANPKPWH